MAQRKSAAIHSDDSRLSALQWLINALNQFLDSGETSQGDDPESLDCEAVNPGGDLHEAVKGVESLYGGKLPSPNARIPWLDLQNTCRLRAPSLERTKDAHHHADKLKQWVEAEIAVLGPPQGTGPATRVVLNYDPGLISAYQHAAGLAHYCFDILAIVHGKGRTHALAAIAAGRTTADKIGFGQIDNLAKLLPKAKEAILPQLELIESVAPVATVSCVSGLSMHHTIWVLARDIAAFSGKPWNVVQEALADCRQFDRNFIEAMLLHFLRNQP